MWGSRKTTGPRDPLGPAQRWTSHLRPQVIYIMDELCAAIHVRTLELAQRLHVTQNPLGVVIGGGLSERFGPTASSVIRSQILGSHSIFWKDQEFAFDLNIRFIFLARMQYSAIPKLGSLLTSFQVVRFTPRAS